MIPMATSSRSQPTISRKNRFLKTRTALRGVEAAVPSRYLDPARDDARCYTTLRDSAAAVFAFLSTAARARFVAADFWHRTPNREIDCHFAGAITVSTNGGHRSHWLKLATTRRSIRRWRARRVFAQ